MNISAAFLPLSKARRDHAENVQMKQNQLNYTRGRGFESIKKKRKKRVENELKILFGGSAEVVGRRSAGDTPTKGFPLSGSPLLTSLNLSTATWQSFKILFSLSLWTSFTRLITSDFVSYEFLFLSRRQCLSTCW